MSVNINNVQFTVTYRVQEELCTVKLNSDVMHIVIPAIIPVLLT